MNQAFTAPASFSLLGGASLVARQVVERHRPLRLTEYAKEAGEAEQAVAPLIAINIVSFLYNIVFCGSLVGVLASHYRESCDWSEAHPVAAQERQRWLWSTAEKHGAGSAANPNGVRDAATFYGAAFLGYVLWQWLVLWLRWERPSRVTWLHLTAHLALALGCLCWRVLPWLSLCAMVQEISTPALALMLSARRLEGWERVVPIARATFGALFLGARCVWFGYACVATLAHDGFAARPTARSVLAWTYLGTWFLQQYWGATSVKWLARFLSGHASGKTPARLEGCNAADPKDRNAQLRTVAMAHISKGDYNRGSVGEAADTASKTLVTFALGALLGVGANRLSATPAAAAAAAPLVRAAGAFLWGGAVLRSFMIFHDAGHGSFVRGSQFSRWLNWVAKHVFAAGCATPTDWGVGHRLHHMNMGNAAQDSYDWGETIFHTVAQYRAMPRGVRAAYRALRHPAIFFPIAPVLTWYVKMRLPIELRPNRPAAYRFSDKMLSIALMVVRYYAAYRLDILDVCAGGDYCAMLAGVVLTAWSKCTLSFSSVVPQLAPCASPGRAWRLWAARHSQGEAQPLGAPPPPPELERTASKVADVTACVRGRGPGPEGSSGQSQWNRRRCRRFKCVRPSRSSSTGNTSTSTAT